jgi:CRISPR-associated protein Cas2
LFYVVSYDIKDDIKRTNVAKILLDFGTRVQRSVFECRLDEKLLERLIRRLERIITDEDSLRIYALCARCEGIIKIIGKGEITKDEDIYIL